MEATTLVLTSRPTMRSVVGKLGGLLRNFGDATVCARVDDPAVSVVL